ncbi:hypothetical protein [Streptomyces sp. NPDC051677]|uniref:hypothetical protein n=1 Tax=Streptomyces sp. NPDC051677 TaxID=3365669 RepID=UPI0037D40A98
MTSDRTQGHSLLRDALPEFLGSLAAGVLLAVAGVVVNRLRARRTRGQEEQGADRADLPPV